MTYQEYQQQYQHKTKICIRQYIQHYFVKRKGSKLIKIRNQWN